MSNVQQSLYTPPPPSYTNEKPRTIHSINNYYVTTSSAYQRIDNNVWNNTTHLPWRLNHIDTPIHNTLIVIPI